MRYGQFNIQQERYIVTALGVDGLQQHTTSYINGLNTFLDLRGAWAGYTRAGIHYFNIQYRSPISFSFTDCKHKVESNTNLYAMMLPSSCRVTTVNPETSITLNMSSTWLPTDVFTSFTLSKQSYVIIMYQFAGVSGNLNSFIVMRLSIDSIPQKHTVSISGYSRFLGNFGLWQGFLKTGAHKITLDYRSPTKTLNFVSPNLDWPRLYDREIWKNRALTVIIC